MRNWTCAELFLSCANGAGASGGPVQPVCLSTCHTVLSHCSKPPFIDCAVEVEETPNSGVTPLPDSIGPNGKYVRGYGTPLFSPAAVNMPPAIYISFSQCCFFDACTKIISPKK